MAKIDENIGFIGGGVMADGICSGIVNKGIADYSQVYVSGPNLDHLNIWKSRGAHISTKNGDVIDGADIIFIAVKPNMLSAAISDGLKTMKKPKTGKLFVSILAGTPTSAVEKSLSSYEGARVIRLMPNMPMMIGAGCTVFSPGLGATEKDIGLLKKMLTPSGFCEQVPESMISGVGALAGSGPAFMYLIIEALSDGAVKIGIPRALATQLAAQTMFGAARMVQTTGKHMGVLKDEVCSPGGTTITGIHALEKGGVRAAIMDAIEAANNKSLDLERRQM